MSSIPFLFSSGGPLKCCTCPEPPDFDAEVDDPLASYPHMCECPKGLLTCVSKGGGAELIGFPEPSDFESVPPKMYRSSAYSGKCSATDGNDRTYKSEFSGAIVYNAAGTKTQNDRTITSGSAPGGCSTSSDFSFESSFPCNTSLSPFTNRLRQTFNGTCINILWEQSGFTQCSDSGLETLSVLDTEMDAIARLSSENSSVFEGTSCSAIYSLRTTATTFFYVTSHYTVTASNLIVGATYKGCVRMRRRESYSGIPPEDADTEWYDIEADVITSFTATDTTEEVATDIEIPNVRGWQYEAVNAHIWPVSADCDCPTSYVESQPE